MDVSKEDFLIKGSKNKLMVASRFYNTEQQSRKYILFIHGFKGFKDWGTFPLLARYFCLEGYSVVFFNFSHNGISPNSTTEFDDKDGFEQNTFSKEFFDLNQVIDQLSKRYNPVELNLMAHSRGAISAISVGEKDARVQAIVSLAGVLKLGEWLEKYDTARWKKDGFLKIVNSRTGEILKMGWGLYEDFLKHKNNLEVANFLAQSKKPILLITAENDPIIDERIAQTFAQNGKNIEHLSIANTAHTFDGKHPWGEDAMPSPLLQAMKAALVFYQSNVLK